MTIVVSASPLISATLYQSIVDGVNALTNRPDLSAELVQAINKATLKAHMAETWKNDLVSVIVILPTLSPVGMTSFRYSLDLTNQAQFPLFRRMASIKEYNNPLTGQEIQFKELDMDRLLDDYQLEDINYWTQAGKQVNLRCNKLLTYLQVLYYKYPAVTSATYNSWIAQDFPSIIIEEAASYIFKAIGKDTEFVRFRDNWEENLHLLQASCI